MPRQDATLWTPDTCGCRIYIRLKPNGDLEYLDDADVRSEHQKRIDAKDPTVNPVPAPPAEICQSHAGLGLTLGQGLFNAIMDENGMKNGVFAEAKKLFPSLTPDNYNWSFDDQRKLRVGFLEIPMSVAEKEQLRSAIVGKYGDKVEVI